MKKLLILTLLLIQMIAGTLQAKEVTLEEKISGLYIAFFNRAADEKGLDYWKHKGESAPDPAAVLKELAAGFATHPSFDRAYGELDNKRFVEAVYRNALGREGDAEGVNYWTGRLNLPEGDYGYLSRSDLYRSS